MRTYTVVLRDKTGRWVRSTACPSTFTAALVTQAWRKRYADTDRTVSIITRDGRNR